MKTFFDYGIKVSKDFGQDRTTCPECSRDRKKHYEKCLSVNIDEGVWCCMHCGWSGALKQRSEYYKPMMYAMPEPVKTDLPDQAVKWFAERMIDIDTLVDNQIGYEKNAIVFPYFDFDGVLVNKKYRGKGKKFKQVSGAKKVLFGASQVKDLDEWIIVEGEIDKLSLNEAGYENAVSVPDGAPPENSRDYTSKFSYLDEVEFDEIKKVIIAVDNDGPGYKLQQELIKRFGALRCSRVEWPEGCKDANEVLVKHGKAKLKECINEARPVPVDGIINVSDIFQDIENLYDNGLKGGESTGWKVVDEYYTVRKKEWSLVTGIPSHGKSEFVDALLCNLATNKGWKFGIFSPENQPLARHAAKLIQKIVGKPFGDGPNLRMERSYVIEGQKWLDKYFTFISPPDEKLTVAGILELAEVIIHQKGLDAIVIDPWNEIDHARGRDMTESEYISLSLTLIRRFARKHDVHIFLIAHPTKLQKDKSGNYPVPTPYDVSGSAHWRNKADCAICVWRDVLNESSNVQIHIQKVRFREVGKAGMVQLNYDLVSGRYDEKLNWSDSL
jgi:twinkle protein